MHRTIPILLLTLILAVCTVSAQTLSLDKCLDDLAEKQSLGPVVAVMRGPVPGTADLSSLEGLAKTFGLKLFDQDGIHVLGPAECIHLYDMSKFIPPKPQPEVPAEQYLLYSMSVEQLRMLGSPVGLRYADLSIQQQSRVKSLLSGEALLEVPSDKPSDTRLEISPPSYYPIEVPSGPPGTRWPMGPPPPGEDPEYTQEIGVGSLPVEQVTITASLLYDPVMVDSADNCILTAQSDAAQHDTERTVRVVESETTQPLPPRPFGPNLLKPSQLDYDRPELQTSRQFPVRTNLKELIGIAAKLGGLPLFAGPGSEQVPLYVSADSQPLGKMLKAVSLATGGTWRQVGDVFLFTLDTIGLGTFTGQADVCYEMEYSGRNLVWPPFEPLKVREVMLNLPAADKNTLSLTVAQITGLTERLAQGLYDGADSIPWSELTPEQQNVVLHECAGLDPDLEGGVSLTPFASAELQFRFPSIGNPNMGYAPAKYCCEVLLLPPDELSMSREFQPRIWPKGTRIPMPSGTRAMLHRVSKSDAPATLAESMAEHGLDTLLLRVFSDGYTIFPSRQFPQLPWLKSEDFLRNAIAVAHSRGIRVVAVIDALRWSGGESKHWLYDRPELIDRDIAGRMNSECTAARGSDSTIEMQERMHYGDAFDGDFVSPFHPLVREKLSALVSELGTYDIDGVAFDHTSIIYPVLWDNSDNPGQTGFNELARSAFVRTVGVDPADIVDQDTAEYLLPTPLMPVVAGAAAQKTVWMAFYRAACDALLDILAEQSKKAVPGVPVWVIDTYSEQTSGFTGTHDWSGLHGAIDTVAGWGAADDPEYAGKRIGTVQLVRVTDSVDLLYIASIIASLQDKTFPGMLGAEEMIAPSDTPINDIIFDFACSETRKTEFLKLLETASPAKTR